MPRATLKGCLTANFKIPNPNESENVERVVYRSTELTTKSPAQMPTTRDRRYIFVKNVKILFVRYYTLNYALLRLVEAVS